MLACNWCCIYKCSYSVGNGWGMIEGAGKLDVFVGRKEAPGTFDS